MNLKIKTSFIECSEIHSVKYIFLNNSNKVWVSCILCMLKDKSKVINILQKKYPSLKNLETYTFCNCKIFTILLKEFSLHELLHHITIDLTTWTLLASTNLVGEFFQPQQACIKFIHSYYELEKLEYLANKKKILIIVKIKRNVFGF